MSGLFIIGDPTFASLAIGAILVVAIAVLGSITVLPALLAKLGRWVDRPRVPLLWRLNRRIGPGGISTRILGPVVRHPPPLSVSRRWSSRCLPCRPSGMKTHSATSRPCQLRSPRCRRSARSARLPVRGHHRDGRGRGTPTRPTWAPP